MTALLQRWTLAVVAGAIGYLWIRLVPHLAEALTGWPFVTDNHAAALGYACGLATGALAWAQATETPREGAGDRP